MTSKEFVQWLKGFTDGVHEYNITPKQWDLLKEKLEEVKDEEPIGTPIGIGGWGTPNGSPFITPPPTDPYNPYKITCTPGTTNIGTITTTPGTTGFVTVSNPNIASFGTATSTATSLPSGSTISYTISDEKIF